MLAQDSVQPDNPGPDYSQLGPREQQILQSGPTTTAEQPADVPSTTTAASGGTLTQTPRRFQYQLSLSERTVYDDNINISHFDRKSDLYFAIEPALSIGFGTSGGTNSATFTYHPSFSFFIDHSEDNAVQHILRLQAARNFGHLSLQLSQDLQILDGPDLSTLSDLTGHNANIDVGGRTRHDIYTTNLNASYDLSGKTFLTAAGNLLIDEYPGALISSKNISGNIYFNYQYRPKLVIGVGGAAGYNTVETGSPDQIYEQANVRAVYNATAKTNFSATAGFEFRQFENNARGLYVTPVYTLAANYEPADGTSISLVGSRRVANSGSLSGEDYTTSTINFGVRQRLLRRTGLGISVGYVNSDYFSTTHGISISRTDDYYFIEPTVDMTITRYLSAGAYYLHRQNSSSFDLFSFYDNQVGFRMLVNF